MYKRMIRMSMTIVCAAFLTWNSGSLECMAANELIVEVSESNPGAEEEIAEILCTGTRYVSTFSLNLRSGPSTETESLGMLSLNHPVELLSSDGSEFYKVKTNGLEGYLHRDYLSETKTEKVTEAELPAGSKYASITDLQDRVAAIAKDNKGTKKCKSSMCAAWVSGIYQAAGLGYPGGDAIDYWTRWSESGSASMEDIPVGAAVVGSGSGSKDGNKYGHIAIYLGDGMVAENIGKHRVISLEEWAQKQVGRCKGYQGYIGWVWPYEASLGDKVQ